MSLQNLLKIGQLEEHETNAAECLTLLSAALPMQGEFRTRINLLSQFMQESFRNRTKKLMGVPITTLGPRQRFVNRGGYVLPIVEWIQTGLTGPCREPDGGE
jgi:hypothetical protein